MLKGMKALAELVDRILSLYLICYRSKLKWNKRNKIIAFAFCVRLQRNVLWVAISNRPVHSERVSPPPAKLLLVAWTFPQQYLASERKPPAHRHGCVQPRTATLVSLSTQFWLDNRFCGGRNARISRHCDWNGIRKCSAGRRLSCRQASSSPVPMVAVCQPKFYRHPIEVASESFSFDSAVVHDAFDLQRKCL